MNLLHGIDCCRAFAHEPTEAEAIEAWNQRAHITPIKETPMPNDAVDCSREAVERLEQAAEATAPGAQGEG